MRKTLTLGLFLLAGLLIFQSYAVPAPPDDDAGTQVKYSKKVNDIIQNKCYGCHSDKGRSDKAKDALMWDNLPGIAADEQAKTVAEILEVVEEGKMPPARFLEGNPDKKLTEKEAATLAKWAKKTAKKLAK